MGPKVRRISLNAVANIAGKLVTGVIGFLTVPIFLRYLPLGAWGLVSLQPLLQSLSSVVEFGIPATVGRELARERSRDPSLALAILSHCERVLVLVGASLTCCLWLLTPLIVRFWLTVDGIGYADAVLALRLVGVNVGLLLVSLLYSSALVGVQAQMKLSFISIASSTARAGAGWVSLEWSHGDVICFLVSQLACNVLSLLAQKIASTREFSGVRRGRSWRLLGSSEALRFAGGMTLHNVAQTLLVTGDRLVGTRVVTMASLGAYSALSSMVAPVGLISAAMLTAAYPTMCEAVAQHKVDILTVTFARSLRWTLLLVVPPSLVAATFPSWVASLWLSKSAADQFDSVLPLLALAGGVAAIGQLLRLTVMAIGCARVLVVSAMVGGLVSLLISLCAGVVWGVYGIALGSAFGTLIAHVWMVIGLSRMKQFRQLAHIFVCGTTATIGAGSIAVLACRVANSLVFQSKAGFWLLVVAGLSSAASAYAAGRRFIPGSGFTEPCR